MTFQRGELIRRIIENTILLMMINITIFFTTRLENGNEKQDVSKKRLPNKTEDNGERDFVLYLMNPLKTNGRRITKNSKPGELEKRNIERENEGKKWTLEVFSNFYLCISSLSIDSTSLFFCQRQRLPK